MTKFSEYLEAQKTDSLMSLIRKSAVLKKAVNIVFKNGFSQKGKEKSSEQIGILLRDKDAIDGIYPFAPNSGWFSGVTNFIEYVIKNKGSLKNFNKETKKKVSAKDLETAYKYVSYMTFLLVCERKNFFSLMNILSDSQRKVIKKTESFLYDIREKYEIDINKSSVQSKIRRIVAERYKKSEFYDSYVQFVSEEKRESLAKFIISEIAKVNGEYKNRI